MSIGGKPGNSKHSFVGYRSIPRNNSEKNSSLNFFVKDDNIFSSSRRIPRFVEAKVKSKLRLSANVMKRLSPGNKEVSHQQKQSFHRKKKPRFFPKSFIMTFQRKGPETDP
ncbi:hypothetical protein TNCV_3790801 [Trichonephila clavipes]|nr:hypothetical protein TNCV_3790801 [Trichonephila clavipes]